MVIAASGGGSKGRQGGGMNRSRSLGTPKALNVVIVFDGMGGAQVVV